MKTYTGLLAKHNTGEEDFLFLSSVRRALADELQYKLNGKCVTARYWITDKECSKGEAIDGFIRRLHGDASCAFFSHYSELTGYLWTDEYCKIGGHDLIAELGSYVGKWLILELEIHT